jgi:predicted DNA-binding protein (MmcQ/YjbR family)
MKRDEPPGPEYYEALARLRSECAAWPGVGETTTWGNPTFKANGRTFAVLDLYQGEYCLYVHVAGDRRETMLAEDGWFAAPYDKKKQSLCRRLADLDWNAFRTVLRESYESVMPG